MQSTVSPENKDGVYLPEVRLVPDLKCVALPRSDQNTELHKRIRPLQERLDFFFVLDECCPVRCHWVYQHQKPLQKFRGAHRLLASFSCVKRSGQLLPDVHGWVARQVELGLPTQIIRLALEALALVWALDYLLVVSIQINHVFAFFEDWDTENVIERYF